MNKNIKLAVAGAVLALSATAANAGIIIPAGEWTVDIGGNVNTYATWTKFSGTGSIGYAGYWAGRGASNALVDGAGNAAGQTVSNMTTGLLPNYLSVTGTTRQNDLDVSFTISINPGASTTKAGIQSAQNGNAATQENRQAFLTFGDKSWGSIKLGKDLGIFASDAILNDMTLLGVGSGAGGLNGNTTTTGRIGTGFMYADWKAQAAYTTPNFNGFQATVGITQAWNANGDTTTLSSSSKSRGGAAPAYEGKASYSFAGNGVDGKVWVSGVHQKVAALNATSAAGDLSAYAGDIGANLNVAGFGLTGYYYAGSGIGETVQLYNGFDTRGEARDSNGGYVQATYVLPTKTKLGVSWGMSRLEDNGTNDTMASDLENSMWAVGAYHPLTKHLNLVAEYTDVKTEYNNATGHGRTGSLGAILFF